MREFRPIPRDDELEHCRRDLRFYPATTTTPRKLTAGQIAKFNADGYIAPLPVFSTAEIENVRHDFDQLLAHVLAAGGTSYSISSAHLRHGEVYDLLCHERIVNYVADLLGENVIAWGSHFFCKQPGDPQRVAWHQDASYWPLTPSKAVTVWLAIDDATPGNGCMKFIAGSHHHGHLTYRPSSPSEQNVLNQTVDDAEQYGPVVWNPLRAGEASVHSDLLLHSSDANPSQQRRCGLTLRYCSADVRAGLDWNQKGVYVRGEDTTGHWHNNSRPR